MRRVLIAAGPPQGLCRLARLVFAGKVVKLCRWWCRWFRLGVLLSPLRERNGGGIGSFSGGNPHRPPLRGAGEASLSLFLEVNAGQRGKVFVRSVGWSTMHCFLFLINSSSRQLAGRRGSQLISRHRDSHHGATTLKVPSHAPAGNHVPSPRSPLSCIGLTTDATVSSRLQAAAPAALRCHQMLPTTVLLYRANVSGPVSPSSPSGLSVPSPLHLSRPTTSDHSATPTPS